MSNVENKDASESISKEVITTASAFHKHIENTYNLSNTNNETTIIKHESRSVATTEEDNEIDTILEGHDYSIQISHEMLGLTMENVLARTKPMPVKWIKRKRIMNILS